jgi:NDP-sugar pyrophosphorylase family protein
LSSDFPTVMILAGGLGTRLGAPYEKTPKSLVKVADAPFIDHQLRLLARKGASTVILLLAHLGHQIADFVKDGCQYKLKVEYSYDGETLLGTGGAIQKALPLVSQEFAVIYGDSYLDLDFMAVHTAFRASGAQALMTVLHNENRWGASNVAFANGLVQKYDSRHQGDHLNYIDYGFSILSKSAFDAFDGSQSFDLSAVFQDLIDKHMLAGFEVTHRFYEIGSLQGLKETDEFLRTSKD